MAAPTAKRPLSGVQPPQKRALTAVPPPSQKLPHVVVGPAPAAAAAAVLPPPVPAPAATVVALPPPIVALPPPIFMRVARPRVNVATEVSQYPLSQLFSVIGYLGKGQYGFVFVATPTRFTLTSGILPRELADRLFALKVELEQGSYTNATEATAYALIKQSDCTKLNLVNTYYWTRVVSDNLLLELQHINLADHVDVRHRALHTAQKAYSVTLQEKLTGPTIGDLFDDAAFKELIVEDAAKAPNSAWDTRAAIVLASFVTQFYSQLDTLRYSVASDFTHNDLHQGNLMCDKSGITTRNYWVIYVLRDGVHVIVVPLFLTGNGVLRMLDLGYAQGHYGGAYSIRRGPPQNAQPQDATYIPLKYAELYAGEMRNWARIVATDASQLLSSATRLLGLMRADEYEFEKAARLLTRANHTIMQLSLVDNKTEINALTGAVEPLTQIRKMVLELAKCADLFALLFTLTQMLGALMDTHIRPSFEKAGRISEYGTPHSLYAGAIALLESKRINYIFAATMELSRLRDASASNNAAFLTVQDFYTQQLAGPVVEVLRTRSDPASIAAKQQYVWHMFAGLVTQPTEEPVNIVVPMVPAAHGALQFVEARVK